MSQFLGTHQNRLDAKGRVSVPAPFRTALRDGMAEDSPVTLFLGLSHKHPCIEGWSRKKFAAMAAKLETLDPLSDEYEDLSTSIYADAYEVEADKEGRIVLSDRLRDFAGLGTQVAFMGMGDWFQIWDFEAAERRRGEARTAARARQQARSAREAA